MTLRVYQPKNIYGSIICGAGMKSVSCALERGTRKCTNEETGLPDWLQQLPQHIVGDIVNRLEDARVIAKSQLVCKDFRDAGNHVRSLRLTVLESYHARERNGFDRQSLKSGISDGGESSCSGEGGESSSSRDERSQLKFKDQMVQILVTKCDIVQLRIEVEPKLQAKTVPEDEKRRTDFWLSDPFFVKKWLPAMQSTLEHICIVDYGQQAMMRRSSIIRVLSKSCKRLKYLELSNMFMDTNECEKMPTMLSLTLRSVKVTADALQDINNNMPKLQTLTLDEVSGVMRGIIASPEMKVVVLGLSTPAHDVEMDLPKVEELHLKMHCPLRFSIRAPALRSVASNLNATSRWELKCSDSLIELFYGESSFITLSSLAERSPTLEQFGDSDELCTPLNQWKRDIPEGLNLQMSASMP